MTRHRDGGAGDIARGLTDRLEALLFELLPRGECWGRDYVALNPVRDDRHMGSFRICLRGKRGKWADFALPGVSGDPLDLVAYLGFDGDLKHAMDWARGWLGLERPEPELRRGSGTAQQGLDPAVAAKSAGKIWARSLALQPGDPAWRYLAGRGADLALLPRVPRALRFHPALRHPETRRTHPALVAAITRPDRRLSVHRTFLQHRPDGVVGKLQGVKDAKLTLGGVGGGQIRLWRGRAGTPWAQSQADELIGLAEGIEDGVTAAIAQPDWRIAAIVSLRNLACVVLPPGTPVIIGQNETKAKADEHARVTFARAVRRWREEGRTPYQVRPDAAFKDINDLAMGVAIGRGVDGGGRSPTGAGDRGGK